MTRWEYKLVDSKDVAREGVFKGRTREALEKHLNELGEQGWELVSADFNELESRTSFVGVVKRPKSDAG
jgi:hypothetical protein